MYENHSTMFSEKQKTLNNFYNQLFVDDSGNSGQTTPSASPGYSRSFNGIPTVTQNVTTYPHQQVIISSEKQVNAELIRHKYLLAFSISIFFLSLLIFILGSACTSLNSEQMGYYFCQDGTGIWSAIIAMSAAGLGINANWARYNNRCLTVGYFSMAMLSSFLMLSLIIMSAIYTSKSANILRYLYVTTYWQNNLGLLRVYLALNVALLILALFNTSCLVISAGLICYTWLKPGGLCRCCTGINDHTSPVIYIASSQTNSHPGTMTLRDTRGHQFVLLPIDSDTHPEFNPAVGRPSPTSQA